MILRRVSNQVSSSGRNRRQVCNRSNLAIAIVGFANWYTTETPYKEPHVPAPANGDEEAWVRLKKHVGETSKATFGEEALEKLWCEFIGR